MNEPSSYYELLGVSSSADLDTLHQAFRRLSKDLHPDTTSLPSDQAAEEFQYLCKAYETLSDPQLRQAYDSSLLLSTSGQNDFVDDVEACSQFGSKKALVTDVRRSLSGGELFALLLICLSLLFSLLLGVGLGLLQGRAFEVYPNWLGAR